jgi:hypothetical protein
LLVQLQETRINPFGEIPNPKSQIPNKIELTNTSYQIIIILWLTKKKRRKNQLRREVHGKDMGIVSQAKQENKDLAGDNPHCDLSRSQKMGSG